MMIERACPSQRRRLTWRARIRASGLAQTKLPARPMCKGQNTIPHRKQGAKRRSNDTSNYMFPDSGVFACLLVALCLPNTNMGVPGNPTRHRREPPPPSGAWTVGGAETAPGFRGSGAHSRGGGGPRDVSAVISSKHLHPGTSTPDDVPSSSRNPGEQSSTPTGQGRPVMPDGAPSSSRRRGRSRTWRVKRGRAQGARSEVRPDPWGERCGTNGPRGYFDNFTNPWMRSSEIFIQKAALHLSVHTINTARATASNQQLCKDDLPNLWTGVSLLI